MNRRKCIKYFMVMIIMFMSHTTCFAEYQPEPRWVYINTSYEGVAFYIDQPTIKCNKKQELIYGSIEQKISYLRNKLKKERRPEHQINAAIKNLMPQIYQWQKEEDAHNERILKLRLNHETLSCWILTYNSNDNIVSRTLVSYDFCCQTQSINQAVITDTDNRTLKTFNYTPEYIPVDLIPGSLAEQMYNILKGVYATKIYGPMNSNSSPS